MSHWFERQSAQQRKTPAADRVVNGTTAGTDFAFATKYTLRAAQLVVGQRYRVRVRLKVAVFAAGDTAIYKIKVGTTALTATTALVIAANDLLTFDIFFIVNSTGATAKLSVDGVKTTSLVGTVVTVPELSDVASIDLSADRDITVTQAVDNAGHLTSTTATDLYLLDVTQEQAPN